MRRVITVITIAIFTVSLFGTPLPAQENGSPGGSQKFSCEPDTVVENDEVRVWFQGLKGHIKVFDTNRSDPDGGVFTYKTIQVVELQGDDEVATMDLSRAYPHQSICSMYSDAHETVLTFHVAAEVRDVANKLIGDATVSFIYRLDHDAGGAKFDVFVNHWPWASEDTELAFDFQMHSTYESEVASNGVGFRDAEGRGRGYTDWAPTAEVEYEDEREDTAQVNATVDGRGNTFDIRLRYTGVDAGYVHLDYDPWVGTGGYDIVSGYLVGDDAVDRLVAQISSTSRDALTPFAF